MKGCRREGEGGADLRANFFIRVGEHMEEAIEEDGQVGEHLNIGHRVERRDPSDEELAREGVDHVDALAQQRHKSFHLKIVRLRDDVLDEAVEELHAGLDLGVGVGRELEQPVEDLVEMTHARRARHLGNVVQSLAAVVAHASVGIGEGGEDGLEEMLELEVHVLPHPDRRPRQRVKHALAHIRLRRLGERVHLQDEAGDPVELAGVAVLAHEVLDLERRMLPLLVLLLAQIAHRGRRERRLVHGGATRAPPLMCCQLDGVNDDVSERTVNRAVLSCIK